MTGKGPKCIVWCHDMKGFNAGDRTRQLVDKLAEVTGWTVVLPDFIGANKVNTCQNMHAILNILTKNAMLQMHRIALS